MEQDSEYIPENERHAQTTAPYSFSGLLGAVSFLQARVEDLEVAAKHELEVLDDTTFHSLTGLPNVAKAREEFERAGGYAEFKGVRRHQTSLSAEVVLRAGEEIRFQFPEDCSFVSEAVLSVQQRRCWIYDNEKDSRGRLPVVDEFALFLIPFMYVYGGVMEYMAPFLPGIHVSQPQFSRLLLNVAPVVAKKWAKLYYCKRDLLWLKDNCSPSQDRSQYWKEHQLDPDFRNANIVLLLDGGTVKSEKSHGVREQKEMYDWSKDNQPEMRVLVLVSLSGEIVEVSSATGGANI